MTGTDSGGFRFASHARRGLVALPGVAGLGSVSAAVTLSDGSTTTPVTLAMASVADVRSLDTTLVTRTYPRAGATDAEAEFFPLVEFAAPELPWLLPTPDTPVGPLPWLCLVAVAVREGVTLAPAGSGKLDVLHVGGAARPADELPDPADSPLWAHAFAATAVHTEGSNDSSEIGESPSLSGCRLLAARRLKANTSYIACLVPTLSAGALAGLGRSDADVAAALAAPQPMYAWSTSDSSVELPVYFSWEFSCGSAGDFESLARALKEVPVGPDFGTRPLDLGLAGRGIPVVATTQSRFRGALTAPSDLLPPPWPDGGDTDQVAVDTSLVGQVAAAAGLTAAAASAGPGERPAVGPLLYARAAAGRQVLGTAVPATDWFDALNRDPRDRAVAGLGTRVLRRDVEDVMARAWQQVGDVERANIVLRRLQVSRAVVASWHGRHLGALSAGRLLSTVRPLLGRVRLPATVTGGQPTADALAAVAASATPAGTTWRGLVTALRPGSRLGDCTATTTGISDAAGRVVTALAAGGIPEPRVVPDGTVTYAAPSTVLGAGAAALLSDGVRAAAAAANLPLAATSSDPASQLAAIDDVVLRASAASANTTAALAAVTGDAIRARPMAASVTFAELNGTLVSDQVLRTKALEGPVAAHVPPDVATPIVLQPPVSHAALTRGPLPVSGAAPHVRMALTGAATAPRVQGPPVRPLPVDHPTGTAALGPTIIQLPGTDARLGAMRDAYAGAVDRFVRPGAATPLPAAPPLDLDAARAAMLTALHPARTVAALAAARVPAVTGIVRPDPVAPVMVGPVFGEGAYVALMNAAHEAFVPGLDAIPPDSVTLVQTNPTFIAAYLAGLNSAMGHELLWRGYPTDERGTYWHSFWGAGPDIGPLHRFHGALPDNVTSGVQPLLVLVIRGRLLRRFPDSDIYAVLAGTDKSVPELDDPTNITRPIFRDSVDPDISLVGFPLTLDEVRGTAVGQGYWFVIAEHPGQPRFGLTDADPALVHPPLPSWDEMSWDDLGAAGTGAAYVPRAAPAMAPAGTTRNWASSAADMAAITYQPAVRVAIRARDLLPATHA